ncbi:MAG: TRAP transporter substrate-binding protein DctP [Chromatiales bacterium]|jgi:TRAP-type C4-dicarboxylate transport system substrate-binding protein
MFRTFFTLLLVMSLCPPAGATTLKIATLAPDGSSWMQAMRAGAKEVEELTNGRVKLRFYPGGVMGNDKSVLRRIRIGQLQGGALTGGGLASIYPDSQIYSLPLLFRSDAEVAYVRKLMDPVFIEGLRGKGFVCLGFGGGGFAYLMSQVPLTRVEQVKQQKVWVPEGDEISRRAMEALGVSPIQLPVTDVLTGLQTGLIDTIGTSPVGAIGLQWHTRVHYLTDTPLLYLFGTMVIQEKAFLRIDKEDQQHLTQVMMRVFERISEQNQQDNEQARQALLDQGIQFVQPEAEDMRAWRQLVGQAVDEMAEQGVFSESVLQQVRADLESFRKR